MRMRRPGDLGGIPHVSQKVFVGLEKRLAQAHGGNPETSFERPPLVIAFDV
jgi:hypothetical protein